MSKDKISDYSQTANSNTDIGGINVDEGCAPSGINNAIRTLMKQLKDFQQGTNSDAFNGPTNGAHNGTVGAITPAAGTFTTLTASGNVVLGDASTDTLNVGNGGLIKDTSGNLGLGVTPSAWSAGKAFEFGGVGSFVQSAGSNAVSIGQGAYYNAGWKYSATVSGAAHYDQINGSHQWFTASASGTAGNPITFTQAMTLDASGNLGIGTSSPSAKLDVLSGGGGSSLYDGVRLSTSIGFGGTWGSGLGFYNSNSSYLAQLAGIYPLTSGFSQKAGNMIFATNDGTTFAERARIDSSGNLLVGTTSTSGTSGIGIKNLVSATAPDIAVIGSSTSSGDVGFQLYSTGAAAYRFYVAYNGTISATSTTISAISDIRFKENVRDLDAGLAEIMSLKPRLYDWKEGKGADIKNARGFIAQEFEQVFPDLIDEWKDPAPEGEEPYKSVRADLIPVLVKAIQEQQALITQLQADVAALKGQA